MARGSDGASGHPSRRVAARRSSGWGLVRLADRWDQGFL